MIKPKRLKKGDKVVIVSLSWGGLGDEELLHKYALGKKRLEEEFGLVVVAAKYALKGTKFIKEHPELRARDLLEAFADTTVKGIICAIGGEDSIRLLPYIDYDVIRNNPKIFMGYSDSTVNHLMMYKAGLISFYGPSLMCEFGEYVAMFDYTRNAVQRFLFEETKNYYIKSSPVWSKDWIVWKPENINKQRQLLPEEHGYEVLQGKGKTAGHFLGGCLDVFIMLLGTKLWPSPEEWKGAILFAETSEDMPEPGIIRCVFRNLAAQGILKELHGIIIGKPCLERYYEEYKEAILEIVAAEEGLTELPIFYNINFGHGIPNGIIPYGVQAELDCEKRNIRLLEDATLAGE